ncbi:SpoIIE family protein phosphatase [Actinacidiphila glaucinigra]|uniref:SpoIIE family protein phosphatase n=1 Tax=Actinacidiphila glaucinigra TaxID=235986 RepID=UPI002DDB1E09|nr:SpoIIE family protein phosphatase [Actinacidiphila glaucinigra]WSD64571.1 SpoIIE family protein phosphatase [Actinacidiphila glaucinigra]
MHAAEPGGTHSGPAAHQGGVISVDPDGRVDGWSAGAESILGYRRDEVIGRPALDLVDTDARRALASGLTDRRWADRAVFRDKAGRRVEADVLIRPASADGRSTVWFVSGPRGPAADEDTGGGDWTGAGGMVERAWSQSSAAIVVWSPGLRLLWANERTVRLFSADVDRMRGRLLTEILTPDSQHYAVEEALRRARDTGTAQYVLTHEQVPGEKRPHEWAIHIDPLRDEGGTLVGLCSMARDNSAEFWARRRLVLLNDARRSIGLSLDVGRTAQELTDLAVPDLADVAMVHLLPQALEGGGTASRDPVEVRLAAASGREWPLPRPDRLPDDPGTPPWHVVDRRSLPGRALSERRAVRVDLPHEAAIWAEREGGFDRDARGGAVCAPLTARGSTLGVVTFLRRGAAFDSDDLLLAEELAATTAISIDNARNYQREHSTALTLQQSLLPREPPAQNAVDAAYGYRPADLAAGVGGDWFDVIPLSGARVALVMGDVVGHGVRAAATMGRLRSVVRTLADVDLPPEELLTGLDDIVNRLDRETQANAPDPEVGASVLYAVYDPVSRRCRMARAAHVEPLLVLPDGTSHRVELPEGPPLGLGGLPFESVELTLPEDCLLVLFTDGLVKSRQQDLDEGIARLQASLATASSSITAVCEDIMDALLPEGGSDDAALLVARPRALAAADVAHWDVPADPAAVAAVREEASAQLTAWGLEDRAFATELIVSELVTNALRHGRAPIRLRLIRDRSLICEVTDGSNAAPHLRRARTYDEGGRGLFLVAQLSSRWGSRPTDCGKTIWAEQQLDQAG